MSEDAGCLLSDREAETKADELIEALEISEATEGTQEASEGSGKTSESREDLGGDSGASEAVREKCLGEALEILRETAHIFTPDDTYRYADFNIEKVIELIEEAMER